jgi:hypothetical protein
MFFNNNKKLLEDTQLALEQANLRIKNLESEFGVIIDKSSHINELNKLIEEKKEKIEAMKLQFQKLYEDKEKIENKINIYEDTIEINSFGLYKPIFNFNSSDIFKEAIETNYSKQKGMIKEGKAAISDVEWTVGGSANEGKKMMNNYIKLILFAFNGECDGLISKVKWNNAEKTKEKIINTYENINKLGKAQQIYIKQEYLDLKIEELSLNYEFELKKYEEKEEQRLLREQMREEEKAQREFERAQKEAEEEEYRYQKALEKAIAEMQKSSNQDSTYLLEKIKDLEEKLKLAHEKKERAIAMAQLTKVGHIYVISNIGSFGENVFKIGMTRRLDPIDRIRELGDASVPFHFDMHAIIYSENAPQLENEIHKYFSQHRINQVNAKKEFFKITLEDIEAFIINHTKAEIIFTKIAEAKEFRETVALQISNN